MSMQAMRISLASSPKGSGSARRRRPGRAAARGATGPGQRPPAGRRRRRPAGSARLRRLRLASAAVLPHRGEPQPRVLPQHPQLAPDVGQVAGAGLVDAQVHLRLAALALAQGRGEDVDRLLGLGGEAALLVLDHAAGIAEREGADFAGPARLARGVAVGRRIDVGVGLAEHLVQGGGHQHARGVPRLQRRVRGVLAPPCGSPSCKRKSRSSSWTNRRKGPRSGAA